MPDKKSSTTTPASASKSTKSSKPTPTASTKPTAKSSASTAKLGATKQPASKPASSAAKPVASTAAKPSSASGKGATAAKPAAASGRAKQTPPASSSAMRTVVGRGALTESVIEQTVAQERKSAAAAKPQSNGKAAAYVASKPIKIKEKSSSPRDVIKKAQRSKAAKSGVTAEALDEKKRKKLILISAIVIAAILIFAIVLIAVLVTRDKTGPGSGAFENRYATTTRVGASGEYLGTVDRNVPTEVSDGGLDCGYPKFGSTLRGVIGTSAEQVANRNLLIAEANSLATINTSNAGSSAKVGAYNIIKADGSLYLNDAPAVDANGNPRKLYKHSASVGMYLGDVADDEPGIIKKLTFMPRQYTGYYDVTGLYAPAGEVIKVRISEEDMNATNGIVFHIGQALYNGQANNIWAAKNAMNRIPVILNTVIIDKNTATLDSDGYYTGYIGSFIGGPIYVRDERVTFSVTVSGAVRYSHFILGYTTPEEFEENAKSSAPYFDLEVWDNGVLQSGPKIYAQSFSYEQLYKAAVLWDKISLVSTKRSTQGIVFLYDSFVAAGAAVAFPGRRSVNCPMDWMTSALNYDSFVKGGAWGNMHEFNHNFQGFGFGTGADGETTNNSLTLVEYSLFTKISSARGIGSYGAAGLSGWNCYTIPSWALSCVNSGAIGSTSSLAAYATLLHNFGQDAYMRSAFGWGATYFNNWASVTHHNMSYYASMLNARWGIFNIDAINSAQSQYPMFVPVSSVYQTGRTYNYDDERREINTVQPYVIEYGSQFDFDLGMYNAPNGMYESGSIIIPDGFTVKVKNVTQPEHGTVEHKGGDIYTYTPDSEHMKSGKFYVTLEITKDDGAFDVYDVDLIFEFEQTYEKNKLMLERTTYKFAEGTVPESAVAAFESNYAGYSEKIEGDNANKTQNCNTDVWYTNRDGDDVPLNSATEIKGKIYIDETAKYRIALRGRWNCALYVSTDNVNYELAATYVQTNTANYTFPNTIGTYKDYNLDADTWLYFKAVMLTGQQGSRASFIGVGWGKFTPPLGTMDEDGNIVGATEETVTVSYASAFRSSYEFPTGEFTTDYFYTRNYNYNLIDNIWQNKEQNVLADQCVYKQGPASWGGSGKGTGLENLVDGDKNTWIHTSGAVTEGAPLSLVVDMGEEKPVNRMIIYTQYRPNGDWKIPKTFVLDGSVDGVNYFRVTSEENSQYVGTTLIVNFDETVFRYYRLTVTQSHSTHIIITEIEMWRTFEILNGKMIGPDSAAISYTSGWKAMSCMSTFGHVNSAARKAIAKFKFTGNRFAVFSRNGDSAFEVYIDGVKSTSVALSGNNAFDPVFLSQELGNGEHEISIVATKDGSDIDSIIYWNNQ